MSRQLELNRFFVRPQYSIFYRRLRKLEWTNESRGQHQILFLLEGEAQYLLAGQKAKLKNKGSLLIEPTTPVTVAGKDVEMLLLAISPALLLDYAVRLRLVTQGATISFSLPVIYDDSRLSEMSCALAAELANEGVGRDIVITASVEQILVHLLRHYSNMRLSNELELSRVGIIDRRIRRAVELMHAQLNQELSLKEIAAASYLSPFHFARLFKKLTGTTPHAYLADLRLAQAQVLLADSDLSITEISSRVGYASASHFSKAFRQTTGMTPRAFRESLVSR
ncbi:MAG TPA: AraC family transcriptional regulator [Pyrinomonadaceae bacterium]|nr:AraC family transcriptional regulator [Pyrinomonadaceae bacterium]